MQWRLFPLWESVVRDSDDFWHRKLQNFAIFTARFLIGRWSAKDLLVFSFMYLVSVDPMDRSVNFLFIRDLHFFSSSCFMKFVQRRCCCKPRRFPNCDDEDITGKRCRKNRQCGRGGKCAVESYEIPNCRKKGIFLKRKQKQCCCRKSNPGKYCYDFDCNDLGNGKWSFEINATTCLQNTMCTLELVQPFFTSFDFGGFSS